MGLSLSLCDEIVSMLSLNYNVASVFLPALLFKKPEMEVMK